MPHNLSEPWFSLLSELDGQLSEEVALHCIGGFVVHFFYGLDHLTRDIDYFTSVPNLVNLEELAGIKSSLAQKHKVYLQRVSVTNLPENYETRLTEMFPGAFKRLIKHSTSG